MTNEEREQDRQAWVYFATYLAAQYGSDTQGVDRADFLVSVMRERYPYEIPSKCTGVGFSKHGY